jgi:hypothetical protein
MRRTPSDSLPAAGVSQWSVVVRRFPLRSGWRRACVPLAEPSAMPDTTPTIAASTIFDSQIFDLRCPAYYVFHYLETLQRGLACEWARRTLLAALPLSDEPNREALADWLTRLPVLLDGAADRDRLGEESRRIWYAFPRTAMQTAVSKLYGGVADFQRRKGVRSLLFGGEIR